MSYIFKNILWRSFIESIGKTTGTAVVLGVVYSLYKFSKNEEHVDQKKQKEDNINKIGDLQCIQDIENFFKYTKDEKEYDYKSLFDKL
jgi:deoxyhypusine synthase